MTMSSDTQNKNTRKYMIIMLVCVGILLGGVFGWKGFKYAMIKKYMANYKEPAVTVSAARVKYSPIVPVLKATGSLRAIYGVDVTTELAAKVQTIYFTPGALVNQGAVLVQLNAESDIALLHSLQANAELAQITYNRDKKQFAAQAISKEQLDTDEANLKSLTAQAAQQAAIVAKKTIVAPFNGRLGISAVNPGQYVNAGDKVVTLQTLDPIYVDFYVPQQSLASLKVNQPVQVTVDAFPGKVFSGKITTLDPIVNTQSRNVQVEATLDNPNYDLLPGMYATVTVTTGAPINYLTLPQAALSFNSYGNIVYVVTKKHNIMTVQQRFVKTGETRGDLITILSGLKPGEVAVTSGQMKLRNGSVIEINNTVVPDSNMTPVIKEDY